MGWWTNHAAWCDVRRLTDLNAMEDLVSYTVPCHKRVTDLVTTLPSVMKAASAHPPVELVIVDYGNESSLTPLISHMIDEYETSASVVVRWVSRDYFHMAHARNVGIKSANGNLIVAFLADQMVSLDFFKVIREQMAAGYFMKWFETFVFNRQEILDAGGFDERFEFYGPEGKELTDRLQRRGLKVIPVPRRVVSQIPTPDHLKVQNYREKLTKHQMHNIGMEIWKANQAEGLTVANQGREWGACA